MISATYTYVDDNATLDSGGWLKVGSELDMQARTNAEAEAYAAGGGADADNTNDDRGVKLIATQAVLIASGSKLTAKMVDISTTIAAVNAAAFAKATSEVW